MCRLVKRLYGLKQSPRCWNKKFKEFLLKFGLKESSADPCLFHSGNNEKLLLALYVDDGLVAATPELKMRFLRELKEDFQVTHENADYFLSLQIKRMEDGDLFINQESYANKVLAKFNMIEGNAVSTPIEACQVSGEDLSTKVDDTVPYREAVGSLMYLAVATRPDISFAVGYVSQFLDKAEQKHWLIVKRILRYIRGTASFGICFRHNSKSGILEAYCDVDYASDTSTRRSLSGGAFKYSDGAIVWISRRQKSVSLSTTEAEYMAASEAAKEVVWLHRLFSEIAPLSETPTLQIDNASAIKLAKNPEFHQRTKHIDVRCHFVRELYLKGALEIKHVAGDHQIADILTKALPKRRFQYLREELGMIKG